MNNKKYLILYYLSALIMIALSIVVYNTFFDIAGTLSREYIGLFFYSIEIVNLLLIILFTIFLIIFKIEKLNIIFPILFLVFLLIMIVISILFNSILPYKTVNLYYYTLVLIGYLFLNIYSVLSFKKK